MSQLLSAKHKLRGHVADIINKEIFTVQTTLTWTLRTWSKM